MKEVKPTKNEEDCRSFCGLCGSKDRKMCKAHIIPQTFFKEMHPTKENKQKLISIGRQDGESIERQIPQHGFFDESILCVDCDNLFSPYDEYAKDFFLKRDFGKDKSTQDLYIVKNFDYKKLKLFFISLLFRASLTKILDFQNVNIGDVHKKRIRTILQNEDISDENEYSIVIMRYDFSDKTGFAENIIQQPRRVRFGDLNFYIFYLLNGFKVYIKADKQKVDKRLYPAILKQNGPLLIFKEFFDKSAEFNELVKSIPQK